MLASMAKALCGKRVMHPKHVGHTSKVAQGARMNLWERTTSLFFGFVQFHLFLIERFLKYTYIPRSYFILVY